MNEHHSTVYLCRKWGQLLLCNLDHVHDGVNVIKTHNYDFYFDSKMSIWFPGVILQSFRATRHFVKKIREFLDSPALISYLNVNKNVGLSHVKRQILTYCLWRH